MQILLWLLVANLHAITNLQRAELGWWGWRPSDKLAELPRSYSFKHDDLPLKTPMCQTIRDVTQSCTRYEEVDIAINMMGDESISENLLKWSFDRSVNEHPWNKIPGLRNRAKMYTVNYQVEIRQIAHQIANSCQVVRYLLIGGHGSKGNLSFGQWRDYNAISPGQMLESTDLTCILAPRAKVQFTACSMACRQKDDNFVQKIKSDLNFQLATLEDGSSALEGVEFLFNSSTGLTIPPQLNVLRSFNYNMGLIDSSDLAVVFKIGNSSEKISTDVPMSKIPECR